MSAQDVVHTIPVPRGWSPEQAWEAIRRGDLLTDPEPGWANVLIRGGRFVELIVDEEPDARPDGVSRPNPKENP